MDEKLICAKFCLSQPQVSENTRETTGGGAASHGWQPEEEPDVNFDPSPAECWQAGLSGSGELG